MLILKQRCFSESAEGWRCPACQNVALKQPTSYSCFCGEWWSFMQLDTWIFKWIFLFCFGQKKLITLLYSHMWLAGKVTNPEWQRSEIPHSCGNMCGKKRSGVDCNHPCNMWALNNHSETVLCCVSVFCYFEVFLGARCVGLGCNTVKDSLIRYQVVKSLIIINEWRGVWRSDCVVGEIGSPPIKQ